jgi:aminoglycoside phosphotransferase (APT) family kinase protein
MAMHHDQLFIDETVAAQMVLRQFPQWRHLPVRVVESSGTVNAIFRIGDGLGARFPLELTDVREARAQLQAESAAAQRFAAVAGVPAPLPLAIGDPDDGYPMPWSVHTWIDGVDATVCDPVNSLDFVDDLADLIGRMRAEDTYGQTFSGGGRGGHLPDHDEWLEICFSNSEELLDVPTLRTIWADLRELPEVDDDVMCHGDLIPPNVLIGDGRLVGVLDTGGFAPADPALDLVCAWHFFEAVSRDHLRERLHCSDVQWLRGKAWAFQQAMGLVWYYVESNPTMSRWGRRTLDRIVADN